MKEAKVSPIVSDEQPIVMSSKEQLMRCKNKQKTPT